MRFWLFFWTVSAYAQVTTGAISGYVLDPRENPIARAEITLSQHERGLLRTVWTDDAGFYLLAELPPATYTISAKASPFVPASADLRLAVNTRMHADFRLGLASLTHSVNVIATVQLIPSDSSELGVVFDQSQIQNLPLNRRDFCNWRCSRPA